MVEVFDRPRELNAEQLSAIFGTQSRVRAAMRQERRVQEAWARQQEIVASYDEGSLDPMPADLSDALDQLRDETYYLLLMAHQALVKGRALVQDRGVSLPKPKTAVVVEKLRDVYEHWDQWHGPQLAPEDLYRWRRKGSGKYLASQYPRALPRTYSGDQHHLDLIANVLDLRQLRDDLDYQDHALRYWLDRHIEALPPED